MTIKYYPEMVQGSEAWFEARKGLLTASEMKNIITPTLKISDSKESKTHCYEILAQRNTGYVEPAYISSDMLRGSEDEIYAREAYSKHYGGVNAAGFVTNDKWGFTIGYSPDWLVNEDGQAECKSRMQKHQMKTIITGEVPDEFKIQIQTGLLVSERDYCDFVSYCGGMHMISIRVLPDQQYQDAILKAAENFEIQLKDMQEIYEARLSSTVTRLIPTVRRAQEQEMYI